MYCHETSSLQTMRNNMKRVIHGLRMVQCVNMQRLREKIKMMSVNQMAVYHTIMEVFNISFKLFWSKVTVHTNQISPSSENT